MMAVMKYLADREAKFDEHYEALRGGLEYERKSLEIDRKVLAYIKLQYEIARSIKVKRYEWNGKKMVRVAALLLCLLALPASAAEYPVKYLGNYDGDSLSIDIEGHRDKLRLAGVDAAEIRSKCQAENQLAIRAREFTRTWALSSHEIKLTTGKREREKYGRYLGELTNERGESLSDKLIEAGLAVKWEGRRNRHWCD